MTRALLSKKRDRDRDIDIDIDSIKSINKKLSNVRLLGLSRVDNGLSMSLEGRLRGVPRTRKFELIEKGVSANTLGKEHRYMQLPISTK